MKHRLLFLLLIIACTAKAQRTTYGEVVAYYQKEKNFNGTVLVATNGKVDFVSASGLANRETGSLITQDAKFKIASISKVFTALLIMKLVEEGRLDLHNSISQYYPGYTGEGKDKVTLHHLLTYSSGIENLAEPLGMLPYQQAITLDEFIQTYCSGRLAYQPGSKSVYGNTEYILLHKIIENVTGQSYDNYLRKTILKPLGLRNTGMAKQAKLGNLLTGYMYSDSLKSFQPDLFYYPESFFGAGALYSTVSDLLTLDQALFSNKLLSAETTATMLQIHPLLGYATYGFWGSDGWGKLNEKFYYRTGGILGSTGNWLHAVESQKTILVLSNTNATNLFQLSEELYLVSTGKAAADK